MVRLTFVQCLQLSMQLCSFFGFVLISVILFLAGVSLIQQGFLLLGILCFFPCTPLSIAGGMYYFSRVLSPED